MRFIFYSEEMSARQIQFLKNNGGMILLAIYGLFVIFYKSAGSFMGDEAIYSQVAKEGLLDNSWAVLHWKRQLWFEKPPLIIWFTMVAFKFFGISEVTAHIFSGLFGILSAVILYFLGVEIFKNKWAGFFAGFIFLTTPVIFLYNRANMMDIPAGMFIALAVLSIWKILAGKKRWWLMFGFSLGMGVMTKNIIGLFPLALIVLAGLVYKKDIDLKNKFFLIGSGLFLIIALPWHLIMTVKFGYLFWNDYFGFHIWQRFGEQIFIHPWENNSLWGYGKLFFMRSGIWFWLAVAFSFAIMVDFLARQLLAFWKNVRPRDSQLSFWIKAHRKDWVFLGGWILIVIIPFCIAVTKLPNYMLLAFFPLAIFVAGWLGYIFRNKKYPMILLITLVSFLNFLPSWRLRASDFGEAHFLIPKFFIRFFNFGEKELLIVLVFSIGAFVCLFFWKKRHIFWTVAILLVLGMNVLIPFNPKRNEFVKKFGADLSDYSGQRPIEMYFLMKSEQFHFNNVGTFYLPFGSVVENVGKRKIRILPKIENELLPVCFIEKEFVAHYPGIQPLFSYPEGLIGQCFMENDD